MAANVLITINQNKLRVNPVPSGVSASGLRVLISQRPRNWRHCLELDCRLVGQETNKNMGVIKKYKTQSDLYNHVNGKF